MKKKKVWLLGAVLVALTSVAVWSARTDIVSFPFSFGTYRGQDAFKVDENGDVHTYVGNILLGSALSRPSTTTDTYPNIQVPFYNNSQSVLTAGDVVVASGAFVSSSLTSGSITTAESTTTVLGVCAETVAVGAIGRMVISGYTTVKTTGTITPGGLAVSTNTFTTTGGFGGQIAPGTSVVIGTVFGKYLTGGTANTQLVLVNAQ